MVYFNTNTAFHPSLTAIATVVTESESTASTGVFNHQNTKISIIIVPCMIVIIILGVSTLCFLGLCAKRKQWPVPVDGSVRDDGEASIKSDSDRSVPDRSGGHLVSAVVYIVLQLATCLTSNRTSFTLLQYS